MIKKNSCKLFMLLAAILICGLVLTSCSNDDESVTPADEVEALLQKMTLREKVGQMFYIRIESLDPSIEWTTYDDLAALKNQEITMKMRNTNEEYPVGGIILYAWNIENEAQLGTIIPQIRSLKGHPLLCIDEEGGRVSRIANNPNFNVKKYASMASIGETGDPKNAYECGNTIGTYLKKYDFDIDFAPVADVNTNPDNIIIGPRAFSDKPEVAAPMVTNYLQGLKDAGITGCIKHFPIKHFPGHGDTTADTHTGYVQSLKTWEEMKNCEMITFCAGIQWGCQLIMTAHIAVPNVTGSTIPSTMSSIVLQDKLRGELGYKNIIITDGMEMGAITQHYTSGEAAVRSIKAGVDIVLAPRDFTEAFDAVMDAVKNGSISEERINQSVRRILTLRLAMNR